MPVPGESFWKGNLYKTGAKPRSLVAFAEQVPNVREVKGDQPETNNRIRSRMCLQKCIDHMMRYPDTSADVWNSIQAGLAGDSVEQCVEKTQVQEVSPQDSLKKSGAPTFGKVDQNVLASIMKAMPGGPSGDLLDKMDDKDPHSVADVFGIVFQVCMKDKVPMACRADITIFGNTMKLRLKEVGFDIAQWFEVSVSSDGTVNWAALPLYDMVYEEERLSQFVYINKDVGHVPSHVTISREIPLTKASSIDEAHLMIDGNPLKAITYFNSGMGPNKFRLDKKGAHLESLCQQAVENLEAAKKQFSAIADAPMLVSLDSRGKRQREQALEKARSDRAAAPKARRQLMVSAA